MHGGTIVRVSHTRLDLGRAALNHELGYFINRLDATAIEPNSVHQSGCTLLVLVVILLLDHFGLGEHLLRLPLLFFRQLLLLEELAVKCSRA